MKEFLTADAISALTDVFVTERGQVAVYEVLEYVLNTSLPTPRQLHAVVDVARSRVPMPEWLRTLDTTGCTPENWQTWIAGIIATHGPTVQIGQVTP